MSFEEGGDRRVRDLHRELVGIAALLVACVVGLIGTRTLAMNNRKMHLADAADWFRTAQAQTAAANPAAAVGPLRRAVAIDRDNAQYRLALAGALAASHQDEAARLVLINLRQLTPDDPAANLELARLEARRQDLTAAIQYYQNALYGLWPADRAEARRRVRVELIRYLLKEDQRSRALSELLVMSANLPDDIASQCEIGRLFIDAGDLSRAHDHYARALRIDPRDPVALAGAGEAAFAAGDYAQARGYLRGLASLDARFAEMRAIADLVLTSDPLAARLKPDERRRRLHLGLDQAARHLDACPGDYAPLRQELSDFARTVTARAVRDNPDVIDEGVDLVGRVERTGGDACGAGTPADRAWLAIAARHGADTP